MQRSITVVRDGEKTWPPPPVQVSAAPAGAGRGRGRPAKVEKQPLTGRRASTRSSASARSLLFLLTAFAPNQLIGNFTVFVLAIVIGYYVIGNVHHALHTPLMSVTNAISGIIVVGALLQIGHARHDDHGARVRRDPARVDQRLRRLRGHPPHARHVLEGMSMTRRRPSAQAAYIVAALLFILSLAGLSKHETSQAGHRLRHRRHGHRAGRHDRAGRSRTHRRRPASCCCRRRW